MHRFLKEDRITIERGLIVRIVNARPVGNEIHEDVDVYKETETGMEYVRNLMMSIYCGYMVDFPDENFSGKRRNTDRWSTPSVNIGKTVFDTDFYLSDSERSLILSKYPDFKWVLAKWDGTKSQIMKVLQIWRKHKEIEFPLSLGYYGIAINKNFYKSGNKDVIRYLVKNKPSQSISLVDIQMILRRGIDEKELDKYKSFCWCVNRKVAYDEFKYLEKIDMADSRGYEIYSDYKKMAKNAGHNMKDAYWLYPKNLHDAHKKVMKEMERIKKMQMRAQKEKEKKEREEKNRQYMERIKNYTRLNSVIGGYSIYVPETTEDWLVQAKSLHQCIVAADYMGKVADGKCLIVFIRKEGKPIATAEVHKNGTLGQFYADELDRNDCLPKEDVMVAMNKWLNKFNRNVRKAA